MKKVFRSIQTMFPFLHDLRFTAKFTLMKATKSPHEEDFRLVQYFKPSEDQIFVDIGSNRGESILSMTLMSKETINIVGFEPNIMVYNKLKKYFSKHKNVLVHNLGLANTHSDHDLYIPFYRKWMFDGLASFDYEEAKDWLKTRLWRYDEKKLTIKKSNCKIQKLDDFSLNPYFIKIDVQGFELEVLKGGAETIKSHTPVILIESINNDHMEFLGEFGYSFFRFSDNKLQKGIGDLNTFCINLEKYPELSKQVV